MTPIFVSAFAGYYVLVMLLAFGPLGRIVLCTQLAIASIWSFNHAIKHHDLKEGGTVSDQRMREAREYVISIFKEQGVSA